MEHKCKKTDIKTTEKCELNRDEIIKALECCTNADEVCEECILFEDRDCGVHLLKNALSLIKELTDRNEILEAKNKVNDRIGADFIKLTEENERLKDFASSKCADCAGCTSWECDCANIEAQAIADTVREYREKIYRELAHYDHKDKFNKKVFLEVIDQISKEMVEGKK